MRIYKLIIIIYFSLLSVGCVDSTNDYLDATMMKHALNYELLTKVEVRAYTESSFLESIMVKRHASFRIKIAENEFQKLLAFAKKNRSGWKKQPESNELSWRGERIAVHRNEGLISISRLNSNSSIISIYYFEQ